MPRALPRLTEPMLKGIAGGPLIAVLAYLMVLKSGLIVSHEAWVWAPLAVPLVGAAAGMVFPGTRRSSRDFLIGSVMGMAVVFGLIIGVISAVAWMLSDPAGKPQ